MVYVLAVVGFAIVTLTLGYVLNRTRSGRDFTPGAINPRLMFKGVRWTGDAETTEEVYDESHVAQSYDPSLDMLDPANPQNARWVKDHGTPEVE